MYEVEVKVAAEHGSVRDRLPAAAEALGTVEQVDTYFDAPHRDFAETDEALRLRRERRLHGTDGGDGADDATGDEAAGDDTDSDWTTAITYKGPLVEAESKTREEFETIVAEGEELEAALQRLGFEPAAEVRKERERYSVGELVVSLDAVEGLGEFVEVETEVESDGAQPESTSEDGQDGEDRSSEIAEARDAALSLLAELGCDPDEQIRTSYLALLLEGN